jgi:hypothetical protein
VREHDALGIACGTGGILQESDVAGAAIAAADQVRRHRARCGWRRFVGGFEESFRVNDGGKRADAGFQQVRDGFGPAEGQQEANFRVVENGALARGVLFDAIRTERRIDGYGNAREVGNINETRPPTGTPRRPSSRAQRCAAA